MQASAGERLSDLRERVDAALAVLIDDAQPQALYAPVRYVLEAGGKRVRPLLVLLAAGAYGVDAARAMPAALAVEVLHNSTLVHDDIMDAAATRRGRPTVHTRWDANTAILAGDYLLGRASALLAEIPEAPHGALVQTLFEAVRRLCEGQMLDVEFEQRRDVTIADYYAMIDGKTSALLQASMRLGGLLGGADARALDALDAAGREIGRAFQVQDDLLDLVADDARWGKVRGGDLIVGKRAFLLLTALERADGAERAWFERVLDDGLPASEVDEAQRRMERLGVLDAAREAVARHSAAADTALGHLPAGDASQSLLWLVERMRGRVH